jgi:hypothetical protein
MKIWKIMVLLSLFFAAQGAHAMNRDELKEVTALILNVNGLLCAKVTDIRPLEVREDVYEVECIEYRGGKGKKTYIMDASKGKAWAP